MTALRLTRSPQSLHDKTRTLRWITQSPFSAPATSAYLLVLIATTSVLGSSSAQTDDQLLLSVSTNLHQLAHDPVRVLIASAFWTSGWWELALWIALFAAILAPVERRLGWRRTTITFAAGHIGATLIVASGLWIGIQRGADPANVLARDVGASYGFFAVATLAAYLLTPRYRTRYLAAIFGYVVATAALFHTFTNFGHLAAVAIGLACYPLARTQTGQEYGEDPRGSCNDPFYRRHLRQRHVTTHRGRLECMGRHETTPAGMCGDRRGVKTVGSVKSRSPGLTTRRLALLGEARCRTMGDSGLRHGVRNSQLFLSVLLCWDALMGSD